MHSKVSPIFYEGQKVLRLSDLPYDQSHLFNGWLHPENFVTLGERNDYDCVRYEDYDYWWQNHYTTEKDLDFMI